MASSRWYVTLELRYWRVGVPWEAATVGMATLSPVRSAEAARELPAVSETKDRPTMVVAAVGVGAPEGRPLRLSCARRLGSIEMVTSPGLVGLMVMVGVWVTAGILGLLPRKMTLRLREERE